MLLLYPPVRIHHEPPTPFGRFRTRVGGFSLTELLVGIGVLAVLGAVMITVMNGLRERSSETQCVQNLRQLSMAIILYSQEHGGILPDASNRPNWHDRLDSGGYAPLDASLYTCRAAPMDAFRGTIPVSYAMNGRIGAGSIEGIRSITEAVDPNKTMLLVDASYNAASGWFYTAAFPQGVSRPEARHRGNVNVAYMDCHVQSLAVESIPHSAGSGDGLLFWRGIRASNP